MSYLACYKHGKRKKVMDFRNTPDIEVLYSGYIDAVNEENVKKRYAG